MVVVVNYFYCVRMFFDEKVDYGFGVLSENRIVLWKVVLMGYGNVVKVLMMYF